MFAAAPPDASALSPAPPLWRRALPWVVALALGAFLVSRTDLHAVARALGSVNGPAYVAFVLAFVVAVWAADTLATWRVYRRVCPALPWRDLLVVRAASYLPSLVNYHVGQAYVTYLLARTYRTPTARVAGGTLLIYATLLGNLILIAALGLPFAAASAPWAAGFVLPLGLGVFAYWGVLALAPRALAGREALRPLFDAGVGGHLRLMLWRLPHVAVLAFGFWANYWFFGIATPLLPSLTFIPILLLVSAMPITPQGAGTRELVALKLLAPFALVDDKAAPVLAAGVAWVAVSTLCYAALGLVHLRRAAGLLTPHAAGDLSRAVDA
ncbi:MAG TPA: lysylphosphatidylglycerol synthase domain-containing protein [Polyangiaceae bacterium]|nr:lysylphosphatidylglycerol synthase domain-containing protein [Polyangiaceae bacterium]